MASGYINNSDVLRQDERAKRAEGEVSEPTHSCRGFAGNDGDPVWLLRSPAFPVGLPASDKHLFVLQTAPGLRVERSRFLKGGLCLKQGTSAREPIGDSGEHSAFAAERRS